MNEMQSAWKAIRSGETAKAQRIAATLAKNDPNNADAWYLLSEAVSGERQDIFRRKALALDSAVAGRYLDEPAEGVAEEVAPAEEALRADTDLPAEFFAYPDNRPEVDLPEPVEAEKSAPPAAASRRPRRRGLTATNLLLIIISLLILVVLYFFLTSLI